MFEKQLFFDNITGVSVNVSTEVYGTRYRGASWKVGGVNQTEITNGGPDLHHVFTSIKIIVQRAGTTGIVTLEVKGADPVTHLPSGSVLSSGTFDGDAISDAGWTTVEVQLSPQIFLKAGTWYAWYIKIVGGDLSNCIRLRVGREE